MVHGTAGGSKMYFSLLRINEVVRGSTSRVPRDVTFFLVVLIPKWNGISLGANSSQIFLHLGPP